MLKNTSLEARLCSSTVQVLHRDYETRSQAVLKTVGAQRYAADSSTEILCACYAVDDDPIKLWRPGDPMPTETQTGSLPLSTTHSRLRSKSKSWRRVMAGR